jgi:hypothetical protein
MNWKVSNRPTPWNRILLEKLVEKFSAFCGTQRFITTFITAGHLFLAWARPIQSVPSPHSTSWRFLLLLPYLLLLGLLRVPFTWSVHTKTFMCSLPTFHMCYVPHPCNFSRFHHLKNWKVAPSVELLKLCSSCCVNCSVSQNSTKSCNLHFP